MVSNVLLLPSHVRDFKADVCLYQTFPGFAQSSPSVTFVHDVLFERYPRFFSQRERIYFTYQKWLTRNKSTRLITTTNTVANDLVELGFSADPSAIDVVPLGVNARFKPRAGQSASYLDAIRSKYELPGEYILYVGRLNIRKNVQQLVRAMAELRNRDIPLIIVGKEDSRSPSIEPLIDTLQLQRRVVIHRAVTNEELPAFYSLASVFVFPSFAEGFGIPPLEAMASGTPAVVSNTTALPEVCGDAAWLIDPNSASDIAYAVDTILENSELRRELTEKGFRRSAVFNWDNTVKGIMDSLHRAVK